MLATDLLQNISPSFHQSWRYKLQNSYGCASWDYILMGYDNVWLWCWSLFRGNMLLPSSAQNVRYFSVTLVIKHKFTQCQAHNNLIYFCLWVSNFVSALN